MVQAGMLRALVAPRHGPDGDKFLVSGVTHRQGHLGTVGVGVRQFRLLREPSNPHDRYAVMVLCNGVHIGYVTARNSSRYASVVGRVEAAGYALFVHGRVKRKPDGALIAEIDCCWPEDIQTS